MGRCQTKCHCSLLVILSRKTLCPRPRHVLVQCQSPEIRQRDRVVGMVYERVQTREEDFPAQATVDPLKKSDLGVRPEQKGLT